MSWLQLGWAIAAMLALAALARALKQRESRLSDAAIAARFAETSLAGFRAGRAIFGTDGAAALVAGNVGIALLRRQGARVAVRRLIPPLTTRVTIEGVAIDSGDRSFGAVTLFGVTEGEVRALENETGRAVVVTLH